MATVLEQGPIIGGYMAKIRLIDGRIRMLSWSSQPVDVGQAANDAEAALKAAEVDAYRQELGKWRR